MDHNQRRFRFIFNTIVGVQTVEFTYTELRESDALKYADHVLALSPEGCDSATFSTQQYGKLLVELI